MTITNVSQRESPAWRPMSIDRSSAGDPAPAPVSAHRPARSPGTQEAACGVGVSGAGGAGSMVMGGVSSRDGLYRAARQSTPPGRLHL